MSGGLRERKRVAVDHALRRAALTLMAENDAEDVTVEQIAAAADVSTRTFFNYFSSKDEVLHGPSAAEGAAFVERVVQQPASLTPLEALGEVISQDLVRMEQDDTDWRLWLRVVHRNPHLLPRLLARLGETEHQYAVAVAARTGLAPDALYPRLVAGCAFTVLRTSIAQVLERKDSEPVLDVFWRALALVASGLAEQRPTSTPRRRNRSL